VRVDGYEFYRLGSEATLTSVPSTADALRGAVDAVARCGAAALLVTASLDYPGSAELMDVLRAMPSAPMGVDDVVAMDASPPAGVLPGPADVDVVEVQTREQVAEFERTSALGWGYPPPSDQMIDAAWQKLEPGSFLARCGGVPVGTGGFTLVGPVARFWGGAVVPAARGRGVYRGLVASRLRTAAARGATLALVHAGPASSPILQRLGFVKFGERRTYRVVVGTD
jgi:GNAT superfamily N-acetyltransferase